MEVLNASQQDEGTRALGTPWTDSQGVHIPIFDHETKQPTGEEIIVDADNGDLAAHTWYRDCEGYYTLQTVAGTLHKCYLKAIRDARQCRCAVVADTIGPLHDPGHFGADCEPDDSAEGSDGTEDEDISEIIGIHIEPPSEDEDQHLFRTQGLDEGFDHPEFEVRAPGCCVAEIAELLLWGAGRVVFHGYRYRAGQVLMLNDVPCRLVEAWDTSDRSLPRLRIVDVAKDEDFELEE